MNASPALDGSESKIAPTCVAVCLALLLAAGCGTDRRSSGAEPEAEMLDAGILDAGILDAGILDAGILDAGILDGGRDGSGDAGASDGGAPRLDSAADAASDGDASADREDEMLPAPDGGPPRFGLVINEAMAENDGAWVDGVGEADDWVELMNVTDAALELSDYWLVDSSDNPRRLPPMELQPDGLIVVFLDDEPEQGLLHMPFKLSAKQDSLWVVDLNGNEVDRLEASDLAVNQTLARFPDGEGEWQRCRYASPGRANGTACEPLELPQLDDVEFAPFEFSESFPPERTGLVVSELALRPLDDATAFIELFNAGEGALDLANFSAWLTPHAPHLPWPEAGQGAGVALPSLTLQPGEWVAVEVPEAARADLEADAAFEGVLQIFETAASAPVERVDFMRWPVGSTLMRVPDRGALFRYCTNATPGELNACKLLPSRDVGDRVRYLRTPGDFSALAKGGTSLGIESVKFVLDLRSDGLVHLLGSERWPLHYTFVRELVDLEPALDRCDADQAEEFYQGWVEFSNNEYFVTEGRRFLLGTLSIHGGADIRAVEYAFGDAISGPQMALGYLGSIVHAERPRDWVLRPQDAAQVERAREVEGTLPLVGPNAPFTGARYQPLTEGVAYGTLRFVPAEQLDEVALGPDVIVITDDVPNDIPFVGGLITEAFQTPLAHVNVLSQNRGTPNAGLKDARLELMEYLDELVRLEVTAGGLRVALADAAEAAQFWEAQRPDGPTLTPRLDPSVRGAQPLSDHDLTSIPIIGAKASQLAELMRLGVSDPECASLVTISTPPDAFAIPVAHYLDHFEQSGARARLQELQDDVEFSADPLQRAAGLAEVRALMLSYPVDEELLAEVEREVEKRYAKSRVRFRSSSNTEDLPNFNGAGLYTSISAEVGNPKRSIDDAMRTVWASLWNARAYDERNYARIDDADLAMAILVHPASLSEEANGVAVSRNVLDPNRGDIYYINAQVGEASVTNPAPGVSTEQLVYRWNRTPRIIYQSESSLLGALDSVPSSVLRRTEIDALTCSLAKIHDWFRPLLDPQEENAWFAMEVEFKLLDGDRQLLIKQARPQSFRRSEFFGDCREL